MGVAGDFAAGAGQTTVPFVAADGVLLITAGFAGLREGAWVGTFIPLNLTIQHDPAQVATRTRVN